MHYSNSMRLNPLKEARLELNLTQSELAGKAGITPNALIKNEQGLYPEPSSKIIVALADLSNQDFYYQSALLRAYYNWRTDKLNEAKGFFRHHIIINGLAPSGGVNPFVCWRVHHLHLASRLEFCKLLVLHPAVVQKYEQGEMRHMPESILFTLITVGMTKDSLDYLDILGERYYDRLHHRS